MKDIAVVILVLVGAGAVLAPALEGGFLTDDYAIVRLVTHGTILGEDAGPPTLASLFAKPKSPGAFQLYRPLVALSYALDVRAAGVDQRAFRRVDLVLHLLGGAVLYMLARTLVPRVTPWGAALGTGVFLVSPVQMEVACWTAARTETISWLAGGLALVLKARRPRAVVLPTLLAAAAVLAKESALVFLPAVALVDWASPHRDRTESAGARMGRALVPAAAIAAYLGLRWWMFGDPLGSAYGGREVGTILSDGALRRIVTSLVTLGRPVSRFAEHVVPAGVLSWTLLGATSAALVLGLGTGLVRAPRAVAVGLFVFAVPFAIGTALNVIDDRLVNSRAAYTPMAMVGLMTAIGASGAPWRLVCAGVLVAISAAAARPVIDLYVEANRDVELALHELRAASEEVAPSTHRLAALGWVDRDHLGGGFTLAGAWQCGMLPPFARRGLEVAACAAPVADPTRGYLTPFPALFPHEMRDLALARTTAADSGVEVELLWAGHIATEEREVASRAPKPGEHVALSAASGATAIEFRFLVRGLPDTVRWELEVFHASGRAVSGAVPITPATERTTPAGDVMTTTIDIPATLHAELAEERPFAWGLRAVDENGAVVAASGLRLIWVRVAP